MQGAPEEVIGKCTYTHDINLDPYALKYDDQV